MNSKRRRIKVVLIVSGHEMKIASDILLIRYFLENEVDADHEIVIVDNGSRDRTAEIARKLNVEILRARERRIKKDIVKKVLKIGDPKRLDTLIILDLQGGNTADDAISLIMRSIEEGDRFASAYIRPKKDVEGIGCWALDKGILKMMRSKGASDIQKRMLELATREDLEMWAISEEVSLQSKRNRKKLFIMFKGSPGSALRSMMRYHPLTFYTFVGLLIMSLAILSGFYTVDHFYRNRELDYFPAIVTMALLMIGGFFMVAGLILNAFNVLVERLEALNKWNE